MPSSACDWSSDVCSSDRSEEHTSELQSRSDLVCRLLLEKKKNVVLSSLRGRELTQPRQDWKRQPNTYLNPSLQGVFTLFLHRLLPERDLADAARARLDAV